MSEEDDDQIAEIEAQLDAHLETPPVKPPAPPNIGQMLKDAAARQQTIAHQPDSITRKLQRLDELEKKCAEQDLIIKTIQTLLGQIRPPAAPPMLAVHGRSGPRSMDEIVADFLPGVGQGLHTGDAIEAAIQMDGLNSSLF